MNSLNEIYNFLPLWENVATSGQPKDAELPAITEAGYEVVINLLPESELLSTERAFFEAAGLEFIHIPVIWTEPTEAEFDQFVEAMQATASRRVYVHCAANMRVSSFCYLYRTLYLGIAPEVALADLQRIWNPNPVWQRFIAFVERRHQKRKG